MCGVGEREEVRRESGREGRRSEALRLEYLALSYFSDCVQTIRF